jgi:uncharacterized ion transporter superfamily protein YfcC
MELIPILSTIILVATICTFILAIGAYVLYKVREKVNHNMRIKQVKPSTVKAELVVPSEAAIVKEESSTIHQGRTLPVEPGITREEYTKQHQPSQSKVYT